MTEIKKIHTPLVSVVKRDELSKTKSIIIRIATFVVTFFLAMLICFLVVKENYFEIIGTLVKGATIMPWRLLMDTCLLLGFAIAIVPPFKMKYWNMGANGQALMGALVSIVLMFYLDDFAKKSSLNNFLLILLM